jgi:pimeloyl-ACP methyl ester carboxylesterase
VVLLPGWPETAEAYAEIIPILSQHHEVWTLDPPGLGDSAPSTSGYDTQNISRILQEAVSGVISIPYHLVGHDVGAWIAYAWAAEFPASLKSLTVLDSAIPGSMSVLPFPMPYETNLKLWQFSFNRLPELPEILTKGKERELLNWLFESKAVHPERITKAKRDRYVECYSTPGAMSNGFAYYRVLETSAEQNKMLSEKKLNMPVFALGGQGGTGKNLLVSMKKMADHVEGGEIESCGHYVMEEQPEEVARRLLDFFHGVESG